MAYASRRLSPQQLDFIEYYLNSGNATEAYLKAYARENGNGTRLPVISKRNATTQAGAMMRQPHIVAQLQKRIQDRQDMLLLPTSNDVMQAYGQALRFDPANLYDDQGNPLPVHLIPEHTRKALDGIDIKETIVESKDGTDVRRYTTYKYRYPDKLRACESLARILAMGGLAPQMPQTVQQTVNVQVNSFGQDEAKRLLDMFSPKPAVEPEQPETLCNVVESLDNGKE
jgi:phage terminase small subunit